MRPPWGWQSLAKVPAYGALTVVGAPWWLLALLVGVSAMLELIRAVWPQESADRLALWQWLRGGHEGDAETGQHPQRASHRRHRPRHLR